MKAMANSETLKALFENPEFLTKFQNLIQEQVTKSNLESDVIENGEINDTKSKNNKRPFVATGARRGRKRKATNQSTSIQNDSVESIRSLLDDKDIQKKITLQIGECIQRADGSNNSFDEKVVESTPDSTKANHVTEDVRRFSVEGITFPNHNADVMKSSSSKPLNNVRTKRKSLRLNPPDQSQFHFTDDQYSENNIPSDEEFNYVPDTIEVLNNTYLSGSDVVVDKEATNHVQKKNKKIIVVPAQSIKKIDSPGTTTSTDNSISLKQTIDLNIQNNEDISKTLQSDDYFYLNMANITDISISDIPKASQIKNTDSNTLDGSHVDESLVNIEPNMSIPKAKPITIKQLFSGNEKSKLQSKIVKFIPKHNVTGQATQINSKSIGLVNTLNASNCQTITVLTDKGVKSVQILKPSVQNAVEIKKLSCGSKPVIKSNERVQLLQIQGKTLRKFGNDMNDSVVSDMSDNILINADPTDSLKMPKIESVRSMAESLPMITSVTSCATSVSNIENIVSHPPSLQNTEDIISVAERISPDLINSSEKVLTIKRHVAKGRGKKKLQNKSAEQAKVTNGEIKKNSDSFSSNASIDLTIEEVISKGADEMHDPNSVALGKKKSPEDPIPPVNGLSVTNTERKGLKVLKPVKRIDPFSIDTQSDSDNISFRTVESVDRSGLPSIKNVVSLAAHISDDCLEEANEKFSNSNDIFTANSSEKEFEVSKPVDSVDDGHNVSDDLFEMDIDIHSENDDFNFAVDSLIEDISGKRFNKKSVIKKKLTPLPKRQFGTSNGRGTGIKVIRPVIRKQKRGRRKTRFVRRKIRTVKDNVQSKVDDVDLMGMDFDNLNLVDTESTFVESEHNEASFDQSTPIKIDILQSNLSPMNSPKKFHESATKSLVIEEAELPDDYVAEQSDLGKAAVEEEEDNAIEDNAVEDNAVEDNAVEDNASDCSTRAVDEYGELLEEVPLNQRRCNNFYVKVPGGEELGPDINLEEYEKFFSIQDENNPTKKIRKVEIESIDNDEDIPGTPGKRRTKCSKCDKTFVNSTNRKIHEATCENNASQNNDPQSSECSKCGRWFARTNYRKLHEKKCQKVYGTIEVPVTPLNDFLRCAMCPFTTGHKTAYINHLKSHMYSHNKPTTLSSRTAALRRKFGYRRKKRKPRFGVVKNRCEVCKDDASGVEHMVSRCRRCGAFNLQWCDECHRGGYSTACRLRHHEAECTATPHTRCNEVPRVSLEKIGPPLPLHCASCKVTRILYVREKRCKQCSSQLVFQCEMCDELRDTYAELCGHVARAHIIGCLVQCDDCGKNCEDLEWHRRVCEGREGEKASAENGETIHFSEDEDSNEEMSRLSLDNLILELDEDSNEVDDDGEPEEEPERIEEV